MRHQPAITAALVATLALSSLAIVPPMQARETLTGEQELAKLLEGRVAGKPVDCINLTTARSSQIIDHTAIVFDSGSVIYVNRPKDASSLDSDKILVTKTWGSQLCSIDVVHLRDRSTFMWSGFAALERFVPYTKVKQPAAPPAPMAAPQGK